jgi:predicted nucleic acid-binding protein
MALPLRFKPLPLGMGFLTLWMCLFEVTYITQQERDVTETERRYALIESLPVTHLWEHDEALLFTATRLKAHYRLSLADPMIAACALRTSATLAHKATHDK